MKAHLDCVMCHQQQALRIMRTMTGNPTLHEREFCVDMVTKERLKREIDKVQDGYLDCSFTSFNPDAPLLLNLSKDKREYFDKFRKRYLLTMSLIV